MQPLVGCRDERGIHFLFTPLKPVHSVFHSFSNVFSLVPFLTLTKSRLLVGRGREPGQHVAGFYRCVFILVTQLKCIIGLYYLNFVLNKLFQHSGLISEFVGWLCDTVLGFYMQQSAVETNLDII